MSGEMGAAAEHRRDAAPDRGATEVTSKRVLLIAAPVALSNATVPLQGYIDTAMIGNLGIVAALVAVGLGAQIFSVLFSGFNFLQIGVSGLSAQALGARDMERVATTLWRGFAIALAIAAGLIALQTPIIAFALYLFEASAEAEAAAADYFRVRIWSAPAELMNYVLLGWFAGQEMTRRLFQHQLVVSLSNIAFNVLFVIGLGWGVEGVALGTLLASYLGLAYGLWLARARLRRLSPTDWSPKLAQVFQRQPLLAMMALNRDIFIRTMLLVGAFAWMTWLGTTQGDAVAAANIVLLQVFMVSAYALDGFAIAAETLVGQAIGARDRRRLDVAAIKTSAWSGGLAAAMSLALVFAAGAVIDLTTTSDVVRETARRYALWAALIPIAGFPSFQLDGIFVGATASAEMRNAMIFASGVYFPLSLVLVDLYGNHGVWAGIWIWLALRAVTLLALYPRVRRRAEASL